MATEGLDEEMIKNGIQESSTTEIEQEYNSLINELGNDPNKANNARVLRLLYTSFRTASGNDKILRKMYKDLQKKYTDLMKINENLKITQENELKNYEAKSQKYNELLKANIAATEEFDFSPIPKATVGDVGVNITSYFSKALSNSFCTNLLTCCAFL